MKQFIPALMVTAILCGCKPGQKEFSKSYDYVKTFLAEAGITDHHLVYFYKGRPGVSFPNVYCFNDKGVELISPPECYLVIADYIRQLNDTIVSPRKNGWALHDFLDSMLVIDIYDNEVNSGSLSGYDYYLFIDYIATGLPRLKVALRLACEATNLSTKKIRLFLVHAISKHNLRYLGNRRKQPVP